jgi:hypothetical protein
MAMDFYAMPDEQRAWLWAILSAGGVVCGYRQCTKGVRRPGIIASENDLKCLSFDVERDFGLEFYLGRKDLSDQVALDAQ